MAPQEEGFVPYCRLQLVLAYRIQTRTFKYTDTARWQRMPFVSEIEFDYDTSPPRGLKISVHQINTMQNHKNPGSLFSVFSAHFTERRTCVCREKIPRRSRRYLALILEWNPVQIDKMIEFIPALQVSLQSTVISYPSRQNELWIEVRIKALHIAKNQ